MFNKKSSLENRRSLPLLKLNEKLFWESPVFVSSLPPKITPERKTIKTPEKRTILNTLPFIKIPLN
jgi:hypothetical protein